MAFLDENGLNYLWNKVIERINLAIGENIEIVYIVINKKNYKAEYGMTWGEWVNSEYNTDGFVSKNNRILDNTEEKKIIVIGSDDMPARPD